MMELRRNHQPHGGPRLLRDRYEVDQFFMSIQSLTSEMDPELAQIDAILDDEVIFQRIKHDLSQRHPQTLNTGRPSTPVEVISRLLVVKRLYNLSYERTEHLVRDSLVLRRFCRIYFGSVPADTVLIRWANQIRPETLAALNARVTTIATELRLTRGRKLRTDGTVVETNVHYPTDSSLLNDGVRVLSRTLRRAKRVLEGTSEVATALRQSLDVFMPRVAQVIEQTKQRVVEGKQVLAKEKLVSLFEPHTDIIKRGKPQREVEFGHKMWIDEVDGGIISGFRILDGNPADTQLWRPSLDHHVQQFARPPDPASADRGVHSKANESYAQDLGVRRIILPKPGAKSLPRRRHERQSWFRRGRRWHVGIEGRISVTKRKHGLGRCLDHGQDGFGRWVGWGVIAANLAAMGRTLAVRA